MAKRTRTRSPSVERGEGPARRRSLQRLDTRHKFAGRKAKFQVGDRARANDQAPVDYRRREGFVTETGPGKSEYRVEFDDSVQPTTGYLMSWWLERVR
jgi:hypothetical protein